MVHRYLVTGKDEQLWDFHISVCFALNAIERRGQTVLYTGLEQDSATALEIARKTGVTVQEWNEENDEWEIIVGEGPGWQQLEDL